MTNLSFGFLKVFILNDHVFIVAKVWNEVVLLDLCWVAWNPFMSSHLLSLGSALDGVGDIRRSSTKVWNEIVLLETFTGLSPVPNVIEILFGCRDGTISGGNFSILWAEVRNKVVLLETFMGSWFPSGKWLSIKLRIDLNERWEFNFELLNVLLSGGNILIFRSEVWYEIILLEALVSGWGPGQKWFSLLLLVLFGLNEPVILRKIPGSVNSLFLVQMGEGILNIAIKTKVWHSITLFEIFAGL